MDKSASTAALIAFDRWHEDKLRQIAARARVVRAVTFGVGGLIVAAVAAAWWF